MNLERRKLLGSSLGLAAISLFGTAASSSFAAEEDVIAAIKAIAGDAEVGSGTVTLIAPEIAENGNSVPISVSVESPMSEDDYVESVVLLAEGNPSADVATFNFSPMSGEATASTRMRLAKTQNVIAVAKLSNGSVFSDTRNIKVTIGGCGG